MDPNMLNLKQTPGTAGPASGSEQKPLAEALTSEMLAHAAGVDTDAVSSVERELRTRFELLPEEIQKTIISSEYQMKLLELAKKYKLTYDELGQLELETTMVLLGLSRPEKYQGALKEAIEHKDDTTLGALVKEVDGIVFAPIRARLVELYQADKAEEDEEPATLSPAPQATTPLSGQTAPRTSPAPSVASAPITLKNVETAGFEFSTPQAQPVVPPVQASQQAPAPTLKNDEHAMLSASGIEMTDSKTPTVDPFKAKLAGIVGMKAATSDHGEPFMGGKTLPNDGAKTTGADIYREAI